MAVTALNECHVNLQPVCINKTRVLGAVLKIVEQEEGEQNKKKIKINRNKCCALLACKYEGGLIGGLYPQVNEE